MKINSNESNGLSESSFTERDELKENLNTDFWDKVGRHYVDKDITDVYEIFRLSENELFDLAKSAHKNEMQEEEKDDFFDKLNLFYFHGVHKTKMRFEKALKIARGEIKWPE